MIFDSIKLYLIALDTFLKCITGKNGLKLQDFINELKIAAKDKKLLKKGKYLKIFLAISTHLLVCGVIIFLLYFLYFLLLNKMPELGKYWQRLIYYIVILFCMPIIGLLCLCFPFLPKVRAGQNLERGKPKEDFIDRIDQSLISYVKTQCPAEALIKISPEFEIELVRRNQFDLKRDTIEEWGEKKLLASMPACCIKAAIADDKRLMVNRGVSFWLFVPSVMEEPKRLLIKREDCDHISSEKICSDEISAINDANKQRIFICRWIL